MDTMKVNPAHVSEFPNGLTVGGTEVKPGGVRTASVVVAASDSLHAEQADYVCDGVNDQDVINAALVIGNTFIMEGHYHTSDSILVPSYRTLEGVGSNSIIVVDAMPAIEIIKNRNVSNTNIAIKNLGIDGTDHTSVTDIGCGVLLDTVTNSMVSDMYIKNTSLDGVKLRTCTYCSITNTITDNIGNHTVFVGSDSSYVVVDNIISNNPTTEHVCIEWGTLNHHIAVSNVTGHGAYNQAFYVQHASYITLTNCIGEDTLNSAFLLQDADHVTLTNCIAKGTTVESRCPFYIFPSATNITMIGCDASYSQGGAGYGFYIGGSNIIMSGCRANDVCGAFNTRPSCANVLIDNCIFSRFTEPVYPQGTNVRVTNNIWCDPIGTPTYLAYFFNTSTDLVFARNTVNVTTSGLRLSKEAGSTVQIRDNIGFVTENRGTITMAAGATHASALHGLATTPGVGHIMITPKGTLGNATEFWLGNTNSTHFGLDVDVAPGAAVDFAWMAIML